MRGIALFSAGAVWELPVVVDSVGSAEADTRLHSAMGYVTPNEAEEVFYASLNADENATRSVNQKLSDKPGVVLRSCGRRSEVASHQRR